MKWSTVLWTSYLDIKIFTIIVISKNVNCVNKQFIWICSSKQLGQIELLYFNISQCLVGSPTAETDLSKSIYIRKKKLRQVYVIHEVSLCFFPLFFFYNKLRPVFCSVRNTQYTQSSRNEDNMPKLFFSHWHRRLWRKTPSTPDRRRTYGLLITQSPDALPQSYKKFFGAKDTKLGLGDKHPAILLLGNQSEKITY